VTFIPNELQVLTFIESLDDYTADEWIIVRATYRAGGSKQYDALDTADGDAALIVRDAVRRAVWYAPSIAIEPVLDITLATCDAALAYMVRDKLSAEHFAILTAGFRPID
jgi:hypothetical protein